jgi:RNA polymerase sigma-70 factor (ECF subfamily)
MERGKLDEDKQLLSAIKNNDEEAFNVLFRKYYPVLCAFAHRYVSLEDSEECVQDAMVWLWTNREMVVIESSLSNYLFGMIRHLALNRITQKEVKLKADTFYSLQMQKMTMDIDYYQLEELLKLVNQAIQQLPESYKEAFVMHRFKDMSYKEIAETLNISPKTVDYRIQQALKILRVQLKDYLPMITLIITTLQQLSQKG